MLHKGKNLPSKDISLHYCENVLFRIYKVELVLCHIMNCALVCSVGLAGTLVIYMCSCLFQLALGSRELSPAEKCTVIQS